MNKKMVEDHAREIQGYINGKLAQLSEHIVDVCAKTFIIEERPYPNNDLKVSVAASRRNGGTMSITFTDEDDGPNDQSSDVYDTSLEFKVALLTNWKRVKHEFLTWIDETKANEAKRKEKLEKYELELCAQVPADFEV